MNSSLSKPTVAVLIPVYNNQEGLDASIKSVENHAIPDLEIVVVDDASKVPVQMHTKLPYKLIRLDTNQRMSGALNIGMDYIYSKGFTYIARLDAGDFVVNDRFRKQVNFMEKNPEYGVVGGFMNMIDSTGKTVFIKSYAVGDKHIRKKLHMNSQISNSLSLIRTSVAQQIGKFSIKHYTVNDYDYYWRCSRVCKMENLDEVLLDYPMDDPNSISNSKRMTQIKERIVLQLKNFDFLEVYSYLGLGISLITATLPPKAMLWIKRKIIFR